MTKEDAETRKNIWKTIIIKKIVTLFNWVEEILALVGKFCKWAANFKFRSYEEFLEFGNYRKISLANILKILNFQYTRTFLKFEDIKRGF